MQQDQTPLAPSHFSFTARRLVDRRYRRHDVGMDKVELANWMAIYAATGVCCFLATLLSAITVGYEVVREKAWPRRTDWNGMIAFGPMLWWRWQKRYLFSTPVTLAIVASFAATLDWTH